MEALRIKELREEAGYSQRELAQAMDVSHVSVIHWEQGKKTPMAARLPKLASLLNCTVDELFTGRRNAG